MRARACGNKNLGFLLVKIEYQQVGGFRLRETLIIIQFGLFQMK